MALLPRYSGSIQSLNRLNYGTYTMKYNALGLMLLLILSGCNDTSDPFNGSVVAYTGRFVDSPVSGMLYGCDEGLSGSTGFNGSFHYATEDCVISFSVGSIVLGSAPAGSLVTPLDFVPNAEDETHPQIINRVRFLMTLDEDNEPENGIRINNRVHSITQGIGLSFKQSVRAFESDPILLNIVDKLAARDPEFPGLVTEEDAKAHFRKSLLSLLAGGYIGFMSGDVEGAWSFTVEKDGKVKLGSLNSSSLGGSLQLRGMVASSGRFDLKDPNPEIQRTFRGQIGLNGLVSGQWSFPDEGWEGEISGIKIATSQKPPPKSTGGISVPGPNGSGGSSNDGTGEFSLWAVSAEIESDFVAAKAERKVSTQAVAGQSATDSDALVIESWRWRPTLLDNFRIERHSSTQFPDKNKLLVKYTHTPPRSRRGYAYELECGVNNTAECEGIVFDSLDKLVIISSVQLPSLDSRLSPVVISGMLGWEEVAD